MVYKKHLLASFYIIWTFETRTRELFIKPEFRSVLHLLLHALLHFRAKTQARIHNLVLKNIELEIFIRRSPDYSYLRYLKRSAKLVI